MEVICVICSDLLLQSEGIVYTPCGHVFHSHCLTEWIERSKSCPQCREKVTKSNVHRLYFNFSNNEVVESSGSTLQEKIDSLKFKMLLKEKDINYFTSKNVTLTKQNAGLRKEVRKVESEIIEKNSVIYALKEQTKYFKEQSRESENLKTEVARLKAKIEELRPIQVLVHAPVKDVDEMINNTRNPDTLIKYISVMKKQLEENLNKRKQLYLANKRLQEDLSKATAECDSQFEEHSERMKLREELELLQITNMSLQSRVKELEKMLGINIDNENIDSVSAPQNKKRTSTEIERVNVRTTVDNKKERSHKSSTHVEHRRHKVSMKKSTSTEENVSNYQIDSSESSELKNIPTKYSLTSELPTVPKRPRISIDSKDDDTNILNISTESKCAHSSHAKLKHKRANVTGDRRKTDESCTNTIDLT